MIIIFLKCKCNSIGVAPIFLLPFSSFLYIKFIKLFQQNWKMGKMGSREIQAARLWCGLFSPFFWERGWWTKCKPSDILRLWMEEADYKYGIRPHHAGSFFVQAQANFSPSWRGHISSVLPLRKYTQYKHTHHPSDEINRQHEIENKYWTLGKVDPLVGPTQFTFLFFFGVLYV